MKKAAIFLKVILSRKGFDGKNGGKPSPILPDGTLLSLPIPYPTGRPFSELRYGDKTYNEIITELGGNGGGTCHLDPDIRPGVFDAPADWKPAFGQWDGPLTQLNKEGVGVGNLFLFFGWFKQTQYDAGGKLRYVRGAKDLHIIYGFLQVGQVITAQSEIDKKYSWHPHAQANISNCLYIPRDSLSWDSNKKAFGVFNYHENLLLTKKGLTRSCWALPDSFRGLKISNSHKKKPSWHKDQNDEWYCQIADGRGQEFVFEENDEVSEWAKSLIGIRE